MSLPMKYIERHEKVKGVIVGVVAVSVAAQLGRVVMIIVENHP